MAQIRANFLILSVFLVVLGIALSLKYPTPGNEFDLLRALIVMLGAVVAHISVNLFNEYSDFHTKIDFKTNRTPFSGGSGMLTSGKSTPRAVLIVAIITLLVALGIGIYMSFLSHWIILVFAAIGSFSIIFYTQFLARYMLGEVFAGFALGTLVVLGTYVSLNASAGMSLSELFPSEVVWLSIPPGILTALLLFINEFPDAEADKEGGRLHLVIKLGKKASAWVYAAGMTAVFGIILVLPLTGLSSYWIYLGLLPLPMAVKASFTAIRHYEDNIKLVPALGSNVITVLAVDLLLAVGVFIEVF
jgi:1,4-dihydroxy-2-naphthoate octaprenyltransferase